MSEIKNLEVYKMKSGLKVMMVSEGNDFGQTCAGVLRSYGCDVKMVLKYYIKPRPKSLMSLLWTHL